MVNWEFFDNQTPASARELTDRLRSGEEVAPTRGAASVCSFRQMSRVLAGFPDGRAHEGVAAGPATLRGTLLAKERGWRAPEARERRAVAADVRPVTGSDESTARQGVTSSHDLPAASPGSDRGGTTAGKPPADATEGPADSGTGTSPRPRDPGGAALTGEAPENDPGASTDDGAES
jgi:NADH-quinone oxidoreductase subunit E